MNNSSGRPRRSNRAGGLILEVSIAAALLALVVVAIAQTSVAFLQQQRAASQREVAAREAANLLDDARRIAFDNLTQERLNQLTLPESSRMHLPAAVSWDLEPVDDPLLRAARVQVRLMWKNTRGDQSLTLTQWRFAKPGGAP